MSSGTVVTAEELLRMPDCRWLELVAGKLRRIKPGGRAKGIAVSRLCQLVGGRVQEHRLGLGLAGDARTGMVWVVDPASRAVTVHRSGAGPLTLTERDTLDAPDLLPGFRIPIADLFAAP